MAFRSLGDGLESGWISGYLRSTYFGFHLRAEWILTFSKNVSVKWRRTVRPREKGPSPRCRYVATQRYSQPSRWECWSVQESEISTTVLHTGYHNSFLLNIALDSSVKFPGFDSVRRFARREVEMFSKEILSSSMEISRDHISPNKYFSFWFSQWFVRSFVRAPVHPPFIYLWHTHLYSWCKVGIDVALDDRFRFVVQKPFVVEAVVPCACALSGIVRQSLKPNREKSCGYWPLSLLHVTAIEPSVQLFSTLHKFVLRLMRRRRQ